MADHPFRPRDNAAGLLAAIVESSEDAILAQDFSGTILTWNRGAERIYGYPARDVIGRSLDIIVPPSHRQEVAELLERVKAGERIEPFETVRMARDGRLIDVSLSVSPIRDESGAVLGASVIAHDITGRRRNLQATRDSEARLRSLVDSAVDAIIVIDSRGRIESFNRSAERLFGYQAAESMGKNVSMLMPQPYAEEHDHYMHRYLTTGHAKIIGIGREVTGLRKDGTTFPVHLSVGEMHVGGERKFTGILHDLTARVAIEEQLREQTALARLGQMAAVIAHEVKNPLAAVRGAIQVIGRRLPPGSREASVTTDVIARIDALNELVKDLLLFARPPQPKPVPVDVPALVASTASLLTQDSAHRDVTVSVRGATPPVLADPELVKIILLNLFMNSAQAMGGNGVIAVSLAVVDSRSEITVSDHGPGIPPDVRAKLFTPFFTTKSRGTGLGLSTVKRLVEAHQGTITVLSPDEGGTTVVIHLPLASAAP
jgi:two-component system sensor kinase FixL